MNKDYLLLFGSLSHVLFSVLFFSLINKTNTRRIFLICGHILVSSCFMIRFIQESKNDDTDDTDKLKIWPYIGIIGHSIICLFFIATTIIDKMNYRVVSSNIYVNLLCIFGQIGMILHYTTIKLNKEENITFININTITTLLLFIFYSAITIKELKYSRRFIPPLYPPLLMISLLYLGFLLRNFVKSDIKRLLI